ncbi:MAG: 30S ribosomal protein S27ae [Nanoarchaeota archaeon]|nr:30S ribosomal protein S27ae [Nanoarchaeota archaeon]
MYKEDGGSLKKGRFCPRCGPGVFLMKAKERVYCGKCHYAEFDSKK